MQSSAARELMTAARLSRKECAKELLKVEIAFDSLRWLMPVRSALMYLAVRKAKSKTKNIAIAINELEHFVPDDVHVLSEMYETKELIKKADLVLGKLIKALPVAALLEVAVSALALTILYNIM